MIIVEFTNDMSVNINTRNRHIRNILFIESDYPFDKLYKLIMTCSQLWGGRYTPIIPIENDEVPKKYLEIIKYYDPDYIYYTTNVSVDYLKSLEIFLPFEYFDIDSPGNRFKGVGSFFMIPTISKEHALMDLLINHDNPTLLKGFLELNLGISRFHMTEVTLSNEHKIIEVNEANFNELFGLIYSNKVYNKSFLSNLNINTQVLRPKGRNEFENFQLIISKNTGTTEDLLYYWNRQLFIFNHYDKPCQFFITEAEFNEFVEFPNLDALFYQVGRENRIELISKSIEDKELEDIRTNLQSKIKHHRVFIHKNEFPFDIMNNNGIGPYQIGEPLIKQHFSSIENDIFINIPDLTFNQKKHPLQNTWFMDMDIVKTGGLASNVKFCKTEDAHSLLRTKSRVNKRNSLSIEINLATNTNNFISFKIPDFFTRIRMMVQHPLIRSEKIKTKYEKLKFNDESYRLESLIKLFNNSFDEIEDFIDDKFWFDTIKNLSTNNRVEGDTITFEEIFNNCKSIFTSLGKQFDSTRTTYYSEDDLKKGLRYTLFEYCEKKIFFKGFNAKCPVCSSKYWFSLSEITETIKCKGCEEEYSFPIEHPYSYKLNSLIQNNLFLNNGTSKVSFAGNYTVLNTLLSMKRRSRISFQYNPQLDIYDSYLASKPLTDIDIICESDGHLIIGEAKHDSKQLLDEKNKKSLNSLLEIAELIRPSKIIIACTIDSHSKLDRSKKYLEHHIKKWNFEVEVLTYISSEPDYRSLASDSFKYFGE